MAQLRMIEKYQSTIILGFATLVLVVGWYRDFAHSYLWSIIAYGLLPALLWSLVLGKPLREVGISWGNWRSAWPWVLTAVLLLAIPIWWSAHQIDFRRVYHLAQPDSLVRHLILQGTYMLAWEFFFRGFLLFGLKGSLGEHGSVAVQAALFALAHLGKAPLETGASFFGGLYLGYLCLKARSFTPAWIIHWAIMAEMLLSVNLLA